MYSDYKSSTTLKSLIGCYPTGTLLFISTLFTGSISDNELTRRSGFINVLNNLVEKGYICKNDALMADKGFTIANDLNDIGLTLNIPPFSSSTQQMSPADIQATQKIARHRIHIE